MSLYYCMSNTQLRQEIYAYGKSESCRNKAAAILRIRKNGKQQKVSSSGFQLNFLKTYNVLTKGMEYSFTKFNKGNLKDCQSIVKCKYNFSQLEIERAGSLDLQGLRKGLYNFKVNKDQKTNNYNNGKRRIKNRVKEEKKEEIKYTKPLKCDEFEDVPRSLEREQPVPLEGKLKQEEKENEKSHVQKLDMDQLPVNLMTEVATSKLNMERGQGLKPVCALLLEFAGLCRKVVITGLICLFLMFIAIVILLITLTIVAAYPKFCLLTVMILVLLNLVSRVTSKWFEPQKHQPTIYERQLEAIKMMKSQRSELIDRLTEVNRRNASVISEWFDYTTEQK